MSITNTYCKYYCVVLSSFGDNDNKYCKYYCVVLSSFGENDHLTIFYISFVSRVGVVVPDDG